VFVDRKPDFSWSKSHPRKSDRMPQWRTIPTALYYGTLKSLIVRNGDKEIQDCSYRCHCCGGFFKGTTTNTPVHFCAAITRDLNPSNEEYLTILGFCEVHENEFRKYLSKDWKKTTPEDVAVLQVMTL